MDLSMPAEMVVDSIPPFVVTDLAPRTYDLTLRPRQTDRVIHAVRWRLPTGLAFSMQPNASLSMSTIKSGALRISGPRTDALLGIPGTFTATTAGATRSFLVEQDNVCFSLYVPDPVADAFRRVYGRDLTALFANRGYIVMSSLHDRVERYFGCYCDETVTDDALRRLCIPLLDWLIQSAIHGVTRHGRTAGSLIIDPSIVDAMLLMQRDYNRAVSIAELSALTGMPPSVFIRKFRTQVGVTPHRYLLLTRLDVATAKLIWGDYDLGHIALSSGFSSHAHMSSTFQKLVKTAPSKLLSQHRDRVARVEAILAEADPANGAQPAH
jgi:AraC-like DNA-binding protein